MLRFVFDCETNGLLHELDTVHSLGLKDIDSGDVTSCSDHDDTNLYLVVYTCCQWLMYLSATI